MAKHKVVMVASPIEWVEPPVTKEEALNEPREAWFHDGFDGGDELPAEIDIDRMVYPHETGPIEAASLKRQADRQHQKDHFHQYRFECSRSFRISEGSVTGDNPEPLNCYDNDCFGNA